MPTLTHLTGAAGVPVLEQHLTPCTSSPEMWLNLFLLADSFHLGSSLFK